MIVYSIKTGNYVGEKGFNIISYGRICLIITSLDIHNILNIKIGYNESKRDSYHIQYWYVIILLLCNRLLLEF